MPILAVYIKNGAFSQSGEKLYVVSVHGEQLEDFGINTM